MKMVFMNFLNLNLSLLSLNNFTSQWTKIKYVYFLEIYEIIKDALRLQKM